MKHIAIRSVTVSAFALGLALAAMPQVALARADDAAADAAAEDDAAGALLPGEILVTARKREESLLKVPVAVTALSAQDLEVRGIKSINDVVDNTPGVNVTGVNSGRNDRSFQQISLRGFTPSTTATTLTASFIDGVPVSSPSALNSITDPARVEILKGPQNAYFGRNAFAGAINVVNKLPGKRLAAQFAGTVATRGGYVVEGSVEAPIVDDVLSFRLSGRAFATNGSYINRADPSQTLGDQETRSGTALIVFKPFDGLTIKGFGLLTEDHDGPSADGVVSAYELRSNNGVINIPLRSGNTNGNVILPGQSNCTLNGFQFGRTATEARTANPFICGAVPDLNAAFSPAANTVSDALLASKLSNPSNRNISPEDGVKGYGLVRRYYHLHLNVDYEVGDTGITLSSLTGYNNEYYSQLDDLDNYDGSTLNGSLPATTPGVRRFWSFPFLVQRRNTDFSQELRSTYDKGGDLKLMIGASYLNTQSNGDLISIFNEEQFNAPRAANSRNAPSRVQTYGVFGSLSYKILPTLTINLEGRYQKDKVSAFTNGNGVTVSAAAATQFGIPAGVFAPLSKLFDRSFNNFLPRAIINLDVTPDVLAYASYSKAANVSSSSFNTAFLSGTAGEIALGQSIGLQVTTSPEKLDNFEVGVKGKFLDGKLRVALAAYAANWKDQYNNRTVIGVDPGTGRPAIVSGVANSGRTLLKGLEADVTAVPFDGLTVNASGAIVDTNIRSFVDPSISKLTGLIGADFQGNELPLVSKYSWTLGVQYAGKVPGTDDVSYFIRTDVNHKSRQFVDAGNLTFIRNRTAANLRLGVTKGNMSLEGFVTNLFNNKRYVSVAQNNLLEPSFALSGLAFGYLTLGLPVLRTFGLKAGYRF